MAVLPQPQRRSLHDAIKYIAERCKCEMEKAGRAVYAALGDGGLVASANVLASNRSYLSGIITGPLPVGPPRRVDAGIGPVPLEVWAECPSPEFLRRAVLPRGNPMFKGQPGTPVYSDPTIATADIDAWLDRNHGSHKIPDDGAREEKRLIGTISETKEGQDLTPQQILIEIAGYERRITGILSRFRDYKISDPDVDILFQLVIEMRDLLIDALGPNFYSTNVMNLYNHGIRNVSGRPSFKCVQEILSVIRAAHTRISAQPGNSDEQTESARRRPEGTTGFIGHGHSLVWRELQNFLEKRLNLSVEEFNRVSTAGIPTVTRLQEMLGTATFAFLVMTAEDETPDGKLRARMNVVHEAGLFQGKLGFEKAIVLSEDGCEDFSNIHGLGQIRFSEGKIEAHFEEIRQVLEREEIILQ